MGLARVRSQRLRERVARLPAWPGGGGDRPGREGHWAPFRDLSKEPSPRGAGRPAGTARSAVGGAPHGGHEHAGRRLLADLRGPARRANHLRDRRPAGRLDRQVQRDGRDLGAQPLQPGDVPFGRGHSSHPARPRRRGHGQVLSGAFAARDPGPGGRDHLPLRLRMDPPQGVGRAPEGLERGLHGRGRRAPGDPGLSGQRHRRRSGRLGGRTDKPISVINRIFPRGLRVHRGAGAADRRGRHAPALRVGGRVPGPLARRRVGTSPHGGHELGAFDHRDPLGREPRLHGRREFLAAGHRQP